MFNLQQLAKQAQQMQKKAAEAQSELETMVINTQAGGGVVNVTCNGKGEFLSIKLKPEAINPDNPASVDNDTLETLEDLITSALKEASKQASEASTKKMEAITGGIKIPGLF